MSSSRSPRSAQVICEFWFEASHQLFRPEWTLEKNEAVFGKCARVHGHSYLLRVSLRGPIDAETGMVINFTDVKRIVKERVVLRLDHYHLNDVMSELSTAENIVCWIAGQLAGAMEGAELTRLELWETRTSGAFLDQIDLKSLQASKE